MIIFYFSSLEKCIYLQKAHTTLILAMLVKWKKSDKQNIAYDACCMCNLSLFTIES